MASTEAFPLFCGLCNLLLRVVRYMPPPPPIEAPRAAAGGTSGGASAFLAAGEQAPEGDRGRHGRRGFEFFGTVPARSPRRRALDGRDMDLGLKGRSVLITGGSGGIGLATARAFAAEGCALHLAARTPEKLRAAREDISRDFDVPVSVHTVDLSRTENALRLAETCADV